MVFIVQSHIPSEPLSNPTPLAPDELMPTLGDDLGAIALEGSGFENETPMWPEEATVLRDGND